MTPDPNQPTPETDALVAAIGGWTLEDQVTRLTHHARCLERQGDDSVEMLTVATDQLKRALDKNILLQTP